MLIVYRKTVELYSSDVCLIKERQVIMKNILYIYLDFTVNVCKLLCSHDIYAVKKYKY